MADAKGYRERQLKEAKDHMNKMKAASEKSTENWKRREQEADTLQLEIEELKKSIENAKQEAATIEKKTETLKTKVRRRLLNCQLNSSPTLNAKIQIMYYSFLAKFSS